MGKYDDLFDAAPPAAAGGKYADLFDTGEIPTFEPQVVSPEDVTPEGAQPPTSLAESIKEALLTPTPETPFDVRGGGPIVDQPEDEYDLLYYKTGKTKSEREALNRPLHEAMQVPLVSPELATKIIQKALHTGLASPDDLQPPQTEPGPVEQGITEAIAKAGSGMTTGEGVASLPLYMFPPTAAGLSAENVEQIPSQVGEAAQKFREGDVRGGAGATTEAVLNALMTAGAVHGRVPFVKEGPIPLLEPTLAERITQPRVEPAPQEPLAPVTPETPPAPEVAAEPVVTPEAAAPQLSPADRNRQILERRTGILARKAELTERIANGEQGLEGHLAAVDADLLDPSNPVVHAPPVESPVRHGEFAKPGYTAVETPPEGPVQAPGGAPVAEAAPEPYTPEAAAARAAQPQVAQKPSKIGQSIEAKAVEAKLTKGFPETAGYDPITIKDQAARASNLVENNPAHARSIVRGEAPLPPEIKGTSLITAMEEHLLRNPDAHVAYELANSKLVSLTSEAAQEMRLMSERVPDGITTKFAEIKAAREAGAKLRGETPAKVKADITKEVVKAAAKRPTWEQFVRDIEC